MAGGMLWAPNIPIRPFGLGVVRRINALLTVIHKKVGFVVGEMKNPVRDLPRVLNSAISIAATGFTLMVTALYIVLPMSIVREKDTPVVVRLTFLPPFTNTY
jgi:hypothetical protein